MTTEQIAAARTMAAHGHSSPYIAAKLGLHRVTIWRNAREIGLTLGMAPRPDEFLVDVFIGGDVPKTYHQHGKTVANVAHGALRAHEYALRSKIPMGQPGWEDAHYAAIEARRVYEVSDVHIIVRPDDTPTPRKQKRRPRARQKPRIRIDN
jgi:hypothetical protein